MSGGTPAARDTIARARFPGPMKDVAGHGGRLPPSRLQDALQRDPADSQREISDAFRATPRLCRRHDKPRVLVSTLEARRWGRRPPTLSADACGGGGPGTSSEAEFLSCRVRPHISRRATKLRQQLASALRMNRQGLALTVTPRSTSHDASLPLLPPSQQRGSRASRPRSGFISPLGELGEVPARG
ncbi:hypothetical protein GY45DRAFT_143903 [Cubamyces sp. BRFM 1775]|nr:hypothetical protein GY45DRAFT_143903 [Cubamyces sp. BRFM 1775]